MTAKTQAQHLSEKTQALSDLRRLCPRGTRVTIKFIRQNLSVGKNFHRVVSYFVAAGDQVVCLDNAIAAYYGSGRVKSGSQGNGIRVSDDGTAEIAHIAFDLYEDSFALETCKEG